MSIAINRITANLWPYDDQRRYRYQDKQMKSRAAQKMRQNEPGASFIVNIEA